MLKGLFAAATEEPVTYVNAPQLAAERGLEVRETSTVTAHDYVNLITLRSGDHSVAGTLTGPRSEPRLVMMDDHTVEVPPAPHMVVVRNDDRAGMIGVVGTILGEAEVSISSMAVGPSATGNTALMVLSTDQEVPDDALVPAAGGSRDQRRAHRRVVARGVDGTWFGESVGTRRDVWRWPSDEAVLRGPAGDGVPVPATGGGRDRPTGERSEEMLAAARTGAGLRRLQDLHRR